MAVTASRSHTVLSILGAVADVFIGIWNALAHIGAANAKVHRIQVLSNLSDAELDARGIKREDIIRQVIGQAF
ncbi:DUF1127 domain-containing protein [Tropicibacter sp. Alg240-R139]|uniref:DUF1127 domain-containing protein n=1 Tax=Tropicibacter sp. Alg240-R139 TaxID=2305991 RepID=UPI0013E062C3|nr:DUF1127 domain-containing protein [Tropicibacter sp. Alg240-R139]